MVLLLPQLLLAAKAQGCWPTEESAQEAMVDSCIPITYEPPVQKLNRLQYCARKSKSLRSRYC